MQKSTCPGPFSAQAFTFHPQASLLQADFCSFLNILGFPLRIRDLEAFWCITLSFLSPRTESLLRAECFLCFLTTLSLSLEKLTGFEDHFSDLSLDSSFSEPTFSLGHWVKAFTSCQSLESDGCGPFSGFFHLQISSRATLVLASPCASPPTSLKSWQAKPGQRE